MNSVFLLIKLAPEVMLRAGDNDAVCLRVGGGSITFEVS